MVRNGKKALTIKRLRTEYPLDKDVLAMPQAQRAAHCLDWCAKNYPHQFVPWNWLWQATNGQARTPAMNNRSVELLRGRGTDIRRITMTKYHRTVTLNIAIGGVRACVDDQDVMDSGEMEKGVERVDSATRSMIAVAELVDPVNLKTDTTARKRLKEFYTESVAPTVKYVGSTQFQRRMLTPRRESKDVEE